MSDDAARLQRWQALTLGTLLVGYTGYYLCRSNLSVAAPLILAELEPMGIDRRALGLITSIGVLCYAVGKLLNGVAGDFLGGRAMFLGGMVGAIVATLMFGTGVGLGVFIAAWAANRFVQSAGWSGLVKVAAHWFSARSYGLVMAVLSLSYLFGDAFGRFLLGHLISGGMSWRQLFMVSAMMLGVIAAVTAWTLRASPRSVGLAEPEINHDNVYGAGGTATGPTGLRDLLAPYIHSQAFWIVCAISFGLTLIRETLNLWIPTYLVDVHHISSGAAAQWSSLFPFVGGVSTLLAGALSDRVTNRLSVAWPLLVIASTALSLLASRFAASNTGMSLAAIALVAFCLLGPYSLLAGAMALDFGGRRGSATAAGLIDVAGYLGAVLSGYTIGAIVEDVGWSAAFLALAVVSVASTIAVGVYARTQVRHSFA